MMTVDQINKGWQELKLDEKARAEDMRLKEWIALYIGVNN
jgi:hypothetical protein